MSKKNVVEQSVNALPSLNCSALNESQLCLHLLSCPGSLCSACCFLLCLLCCCLFVCLMLCSYAAGTLLALLVLVPLVLTSPLLSSTSSLNSLLIRLTIANCSSTVCISPLFLILTGRCVLKIGLFLRPKFFLQISSSS